MNVNLAVHFFLQISVILLACRLVGILAKKFGQPQVVAEMMAGVMLGPSVLGSFFPETFSLLFPWDASQKVRETQSYLYFASQLGLALYMFVVGLEFRLDILRGHFKSAFAVSMAGMLVPLFLGAGVAYLFKTQTSFFPETTSLSEAMLFLGAAMWVGAN